MSGETAGGFFPPLFFSPLVCARFYTCFCSFAARSSALSTNKPPATYCCVGFQSQAKGQSISLRTKKQTLCMLVYFARRLAFQGTAIRRCEKTCGTRKTDLRLFLLSRSSWPTKRYLEETSALYAGYIFTYIQVRKYKNHDISAQGFFVALSAKFQSFTFRKSQKTRPV